MKGLRRILFAARYGARLALLALPVALVASLALSDGKGALAQQSPEHPGATPTAHNAVRQTIENVRENAQPNTQPAPGGVASASQGAVVSQGQEPPKQIQTAQPFEPGVRPILGGSRAFEGGPRSQVPPTLYGVTGTFEPIQNLPVEYGDVPDVDAEITLMPTETGAVPVVALLDDLAELTGWNIVASKGVESEQLRFWLNGVTPKQALKVLQFNKIHYEFDPETNFLFVMLEEEYLDREYGDVVTAQFPIEHADITDMESVLSGLLSAKGKLVSDPRTGQILVWDTKENVEAMREAVSRFDEPIEPRAYELKYVSAETLGEGIQPLLSQRGVAQVDTRSNTLVVSDLPSRQDQVAAIVEALDAKVETRTWALDYADIETVGERLEAILPEDVAAITTDELTHQVSVTAVSARLDEVDGMIASWDVPNRQVMIEAYIVAARSTVSRDLGIDWSYFDEVSGVPFALQSGSNRPNYRTAPGEGQRLSVGRWPYRQFLRDPVTRQRYQWIEDDNNDEAGALTDEYVLDPEFKGNRVGIVLNYLDSTGALDVLSRPRVTVQDGEEATFESTTDIPYQQGGYSQYTFTDSDNPSFNRVIPLQVEFVTVGTVLTVKPRINLEDRIRLTIEAEDSSAEIVTVTVGDQRSTVPQKTENKATTDVMVHDQQTIVVGGLRFTSLDDNVERVPLLGELPLIGRLFRTTEKENEDRELLVFLTTTIVDEFTHPEAEGLAGREQDVTGRLRHDSKGVFGRTKDRLLGKDAEIAVSIGQNGAMYSEGGMVTLDELREQFGARDRAMPATVVIRTHPRAPRQIADDVELVAREAGLKVKRDDSVPPFVPVMEPREQDPEISAPEEPAAAP